MKDFTLEIIDDELMWTKKDEFGTTKLAFEVFRPNEYEARKLYKQLEVLFKNRHDSSVGRARA